METKIITNEHGEKIIVKIENDRIFVHHEDCTDSFIPLDELLINWILSGKELIAINNAVNNTLKKINK
ncbi:MAG: hypothetical protein IPJ01_10905 [Micavibrio sp.]|nr:hypothetical protein [Micavibrio sp.]